jgi:acyl-CoA thioester hydrolase
MRDELTVLMDASVKSDWVDYNGHMGDYAYGIVFSDAITAFMDMIGVDAAYRASTRCTLYTLEMRIAYLKECHTGQEFRVVQQIVDHDSKRFHAFQIMSDRKTGEALAWCEQLLMHMKQSASTPPKSVAFPETILATLNSIAEPQEKMPRPDWVGKPMGIRRR